MGQSIVLKVILAATLVLLAYAPARGDNEQRCAITIDHTQVQAGDEAQVAIRFSTPGADPIAVSSVTLAIAIDTGSLAIQGITPGNELAPWQMTDFELIPLDHPTYQRLLLLYATCDEDSTQTALIDSTVIWQLTVSTEGSTPPGSVVPVPFMFNSCLDNLILTATHDTALMPLTVFNHDSFDITDPSAEMPSLSGPHQSCLDSPIGGHSTPHRSVDYYSGAIITTNNFGDLPGDIDLDGQRWQEPDLDLYCSFFQLGDTVFGIDQQRQIAASDIDRDQTDTTLTDLAALRYRMLGIPLSTPAPVIYHGQFLYYVQAVGQLRVSLRTDCPIGAYNLWFSTVGCVVDSVVFLHDHETGQFGQHEALQHAARLRLLGLGGTPATPWIDTWQTDLAVIYYQGSNKPLPVIERLAAADLSPVAIGEFTHTPEELPVLPHLPYLAANYPNPFNPSTRIDFYLPRKTAWRLDIYGITGRIVRQFNGHNSRGWTSIQWDGHTGRGEPVASGVYLYRLDTGTWSSARKMLLVK